MNEIRLIVDPPARGTWNMAVDEAILRGATDLGIPTLRFYSWSEPTLSLGYFQKYEQRQQHLASSDCVCVRRASGGGAIMHDRELTYSFVAPVRDSRSEETTRWFDLFHETLIEVLANWGINAHLSGKPQASSTPEPFLCFLRRHEVDVIVDGNKICGSAQRRHQVAVLQHGSVILQQSRCAPELQGLEEITGQQISAELLIDRWKDNLNHKFKSTYIQTPLTAKEVESAQTIESVKFAHPDWTHKR